MTGWGIAVVPVRAGALPLGADETVAESGGVALLVGSGTIEAAERLGPRAGQVEVWEAGDYRPGAWAARLAAQLAGYDTVLLPASPDGRDLAPRLALMLDRPLYAPAMTVTPGQVTVIRGSGLRLEEHTRTGPCVATLQPGVRGAEAVNTAVPIPVALHPVTPPSAIPDALFVDLLAADPTTVDLADARVILTAGAGLGSAECVDLAVRVATGLHASFGATRVVTDAGWAPVSRQIGTTGVVVSPAVYLAFGVSGAVQHLSGLGRPDTVIAVNTDESCPMMAMANLALVSDARALLQVLAERLGVAAPPGGGVGP
ncbi:MAG TPA: mycofactocin-associated electron transfer flavoprotein alpha subunit [Mycobacteriales bacterium]|nr:mycofactocin-associated electron transfer flavoprotein alpha subunit [Mycobacteriales bacterium]